MHEMQDDKNMKYILVIGDGMADNPIAELDSKTPLDYANIPTMDSLAAHGTIGTVLTTPKDMAPGSDIAILSIFGVDPAIYYKGRAPLEAAAFGIGLNAGDIALRCNFVSIASKLAVAPAGEEDVGNPAAGEAERTLTSHSAGGIDENHCEILLRDLFSDEEFLSVAKNIGLEIFSGSSYRNIAVIKAGGNGILSSLKLHPPHDHIGENITDILPSGSEIAEQLRRLMEISFDVLDKHPLNKARIYEGKLPANGIWFWAAGETVDLPSFHDKYGKKGAVISAVPLCWGIGMLMGLGRIIVEGATGDLYTNYEGKADAAFSALETNDFVCVHVEAPDECTHNGDLDGKIRAIEWIDSRLLKRLKASLDESGMEYKMIVMSDHKTLISTRGHDADAVPFLLYDSRAKDGVASDIRQSFCEVTAQYGEYIDDGTKLMERLFE